MHFLNRHSSAALLAALASTAIGALLAVSPTAQATSDAVVVKPSRLSRGANIAVAHIEGTTIVDGAVRIPITGADRVELMGRTGRAYVVRTFTDRGVAGVLRATPDGTVTTLVTPAKKGDLVELSTDGTRLAQAVPAKGFTTTTIQLWNAADGAPLTSKTFTGLTGVLDLDATRVIIADQAAGTTSAWTTATGKVKLVTRGIGYLADVSADRVAVFDKDPFEGGCTVVSALSAPKRVLWRSCVARVENFSPSGRRMATVALLSDGLGPSEVTVRSSVGVSKGIYRIKGYFGLLTWETNDALLLESYGRAQGAIVRCTPSGCERASDLVPTPNI